MPGPRFTPPRALDESGGDVGDRASSTSFDAWLTDLNEDAGEHEPTRTIAESPLAGHRSSDEVVRRSARRLPPGHRVGRYLVIDELGAGGMSVVYAAYDPQLDRRIALKLMRPERALNERSGQRLLREAQALARLSHPNIIGVHDVGMNERELVVAMEFVDGVSLREWQRSAARGWREVLRIYADAGRGLAAAHRAGIVHRDVKPANIMLGADGRVRVLDFGLAAALEGFVSGSGFSASLSEDEATPSSSLDSDLTVPGSLMGTPAYMSPEQHRAEPASAAGDQYAFCASLYEALYRKRPFALEQRKFANGQALAESLSALEQRKRAHELAPPPESDVPAWVFPIVRRGLAPEPGERWPSMDSLVAALGDDPTVRRRRRLQLALVALALVALMALGAVGWLRQPAIAAGADPCTAAARSLEGVWGPDMRERVRVAFAATGRVTAGGTFDRVGDLLDTYADEWRGMHAEACAATRAQKTQSEHVLALRLECLGRGRNQLAQLTNLLAGPIDPELYASSIASVQQLRPVAECGQVDALLAAVPLPDEPALRARIDAVRDQLDRSEALRRAGRFREALDTARAQVAEAEAIDYAPLSAEVVFWNARPLLDLDRLDEAEEGLRAAVRAAGEARAPALLITTWTDLLGAMRKRGRSREVVALELGVMATAALAGDRLLRAEALYEFSSAYGALAQYEEARERGLEALAIRERELPPHDFRLATSNNDLGQMLMDMGQHEQGIAHLQRAEEIWRLGYGVDHPRRGLVLGNLASARQRQGDFDAAMQLYEEALTIMSGEGGWGADNSRVANVLNNQATLLVSKGEYQQARTLQERAMALQVAAYGDLHPEVASSYNNLGVIEREAGNSAQARAHFLRALEIREAMVGAEHPDLGPSLNNLGGLAQSEGDLEAARAYYERALANREAASGAEHPEVALYLNNIGSLLLTGGSYPEAVPYLERSLALRGALLGEDHPEMVYPHANLAFAATELGNYEDAHDHLDAASAVVEAFDPDDRTMALVLNNRAELLVREGKPAEAREAVERARAILEARGKIPTWWAKSEWILARALWGSAPGRRSEARALAESARHTYEAHKASRVIARIDRWLSERAR